MVIPDHAKGILITGIGVLILTPDGLLVRLIEASDWTVTFWRGLLSAMFILGGLAVAQRGQFVSNVRAIGMPGILFATVFGIGTVFFVMSVFLTSVANVLFIIAISPLFSALIAMFLLKEKVNRTTWIGIAIALFGVGVIVSGSVENGPGSVLGDILAFGGAVTLASTFCIARKWRDRSMVPAMGLAGIVTAIIALPFAVPFEIAGWSIVFAVLMGLISAVAFGMMTVGPRYLPAPEVGLLLLLEAVLGPYWVWLVLGEDPGTATIIGGAIVLVTLALLNGFMLFRNNRSVR